ncbi:MAG TPA: efflux transporter outer membrane subunit [Caulobacteraceae bacterium]|jgi:multidrug efflux system outer membrane protein
MKKRETLFRILRGLAIVAPAILVADCTVGPDYHRPAVTVPTDFRAQPGPSDANSLADLSWWEVFNDSTLQGLISEALANNLDVKVAVARIEQARALVGVAKSQAYPQVGYQGFASDQKALIPTENEATTTYATWGGFLSAAWELDIWGRIRRSTEAARADLYAQEDVRRGVTLTLVSDVAAGYFQLLALDRRLDVAEESARVYTQNLNLFTLRFQAGRDSNLPVQRAQASLDSSNATISDLKRLIALQEDALSVLLGAYPRDINRGQSLDAQTVPTTPVGMTTDLLKRRPDILGAEQTMISANAQVGVAVANFYPTIGLSALVGGQGVSIQHGLNGTFGIWSVAGDVAGPIFTGGRLQAQYHQRQAYWDETVAQYRKTVLVAFQETSDALAAQQTLAGRRVALQSQVQAQRRAVDLSLLRYDSGRANYFEVLEAEQELFPAEDALAQTQADQLIAVVSLYKALGGGWKLQDAEWSRPH